MANYKEIKDLIQLRHKIIHPTKDDLKLPIYKIIDACSHSFAFIKDIESEFVQSGRQPICDDPW